MCLCVLAQPLYQQMQKRSANVSHCAVMLTWLYRPFPPLALRIQPLTFTTELTGPLLKRSLL